MEIQQPMTLKGRYVFTKAKLEKKEHFMLHDIIVARKAAGQEFMSLVRKLNAMCRTEQFVIENIVPTVGRTLIANNLTDATPDNTMLINKVALGTGSSTPANGDTTLQTETYRNAVASLTNASNVAYATGFFNATEVTGTFNEAGLFCNGTGSANSGVLLSRVALSAISKSVTETLTLDWTLTIS